MMINSAKQAVVTGLCAAALLVWIGQGAGPARAAESPALSPGAGMAGSTAGMNAAMGSADEQMAALPEGSEGRELLSAMRDSAETGRRLASMGAVPESRVEVRDAHAIGQQTGRPDVLRSAEAQNSRGIEDLRQDILKNRSLDRAVSRQQVPFDHVVAANVEPGGQVVIYAWPQNVPEPK